jgi:hypothetical protein
MLTRRELIRTGAAAAAFSAAGPVFARARLLPLVDPQLMSRALDALEAKRRFLTDTDVIAIADFAQPSREERFYIVRTDSGIVTRYHVAHGRGSDPAHSGYLDRFSNAPGSAASSAGAYVTGDLYHGKYGRSMRLKGLDRSNSNAEPRGIVVHAAPYAEPEMVDRIGKLGRSEGCFALSQLGLFLVLRQLGPGRLLYCDKL